MKRFGLPLLLLLVASPALATLSGHKWFTSSFPVPYRVFAHDTINNMPAHSFTQAVSGHSVILAVVQNAFHNWTCFSGADCRVPGTGWESAYTGPFTSPVGNAAVNASDLKNNVLWEGGTDWHYDPMLTLGLTTTTFYSSSGQIIDADMELNNNVKWDDVGASNAYDYESVVLHEAGHFLGLDHTTNVQIAVMYPTVNLGPTGQKRSLAAVDISDVTTLYPNGQTVGGQGAPCTSSNDCDTALACRASSGSSASLCTVDCTQGATCPAPNTCQAADTGKACFAPPSSSDYCSFCTDGTQCNTGLCVADGFGHNWCSIGCTPMSDCGTGSTCIDTATEGACNGSGSCLCAPTAFKCPNQCSGATCSPGYACTGGTCEASGNAGDRCETSGICHQCLRCVGNSTAAYCLTCCGGSTTNCQGCTAAQCGTGAACTPITGSDDSVCAPTSGAMTCAACGSGVLCQNGETCVGGLCHPDCNPQTPGTCPACAAETSTSGLCVCTDNEIHTEGQNCGVGTTVAACELGLICSGGKCARPCALGDPASCPSGQVCTNLNGTPTCVTGSAGGKCDACNNQQCTGGNVCFAGRCYGPCNVNVKNGPCDSACVDVGSNINVCACDDEIGGVGHACGGSPVGACSTGLLCIAGVCEGSCDPHGMNYCPLLTECKELPGQSGMFVCQPLDMGTGGGGGGGTFARGGGTQSSGGGDGFGGGGSTDSGCGCGSAPGAFIALAFAVLLLRRRPLAVKARSSQR